MILSYDAATLFDRCEGTRGAEGGDDAIHSSSATALETPPLALIAAKAPEVPRAETTPSKRISRFILDLYWALFARFLLPKMASGSFSFHSEPLGVDFELPS